MILLISCNITYINNIVIVNSKVFVVRIDIDNGVLITSIVIYTRTGRGRGIWLSMTLV